jgi:hypothetical protein
MPGMDAQDQRYHFASNKDVHEQRQNEATWP